MSQAISTQPTGGIAIEQPEFAPRLEVAVPSPLGHPKIVAAIPAYNEEAAIGTVVLKARLYAAEVVVVDDGSTDGTAKVAMLAGARVISHPRNLGKGAAIRTALDYILQDGADIIVLHDGDMQHDPADIPAVVEPILAGRADVVIGTRDGSSNGMPRYRRLGARVLDHATSWATGKRVLTDSQCGFRAFCRKAADALRPRSRGIGVESEMLIRSVRDGYRLAEVPVSSRYDVEGSTMNPARHAMQVLHTIVSMTSERRPLLVFGGFGTALLGTGGTIGIYTSLLYASTGEFALGDALLFVTLTVVGAMSVFTGLILNRMGPPAGHARDA